MYERKHQPLASRNIFRHRIFNALIIDLIVIFIALFIGMSGYHFIGKLGWVDSFLNASMILGGMGPVDVMPNDDAKIFSGLYAILCGVTLISLFAILLTPLFHRFIHRFHLEEKE
jgi:sterol desaturase/sphingolipid hydroxylase (fatty acid hydroxylase superfamily)